MKKKKVILAFSGGLDTSFCVVWLKKQGFDVITLTIDTGGFTKKDQKDIAKQSKLLGATKHYFLDAKHELYDRIVSYIIKGNILRGGVYPLCAGPERLIIAIKLVEITHSEKAQIVAHGSTGAGNDQVRFDVAIKTLDPSLKTIVPIRELGMSRKSELQYLKKCGADYKTNSKDYSVNKGMLGITIGGKETKESWKSLPEDVYEGITPLGKTPDKPEHIILSFEKGLPIAINGKSANGLIIMRMLKKLGGKHGVGKNIHLGTTILGIKGRVAFAAPAMEILIKAHRELEKLVLTKRQLFWKDTLSKVYGNFLHEALYFDPVMRDLEAMIDSSQRYVSGDAKVKLFKGNVIIEGVKSQYSLLNKSVAIYGEKNVLWSGIDAVGFSKIYGLESMLSVKVQK